jgi:dissimilatory sulfite reductase (desulfoviridin) alpha/beta subunit
MTSYPNPWIFNGKEFDDNDAVGHVGFVYQITAPTGKIYIGKKIFHLKRRLKRKDKRDKIKHVDSSWKTYYGSSEELSADVEKLGAENFQRKILRVCKTKSEMSYFEGKYQFSEEVLERDDTYNKWISLKVRQKITR